MASRRSKDPWMAPDAFGRSLPAGIGVSLLLPEIVPMEAFVRDVLGARIIYSDEDFAAVECLGSILLLHADHTYAGHEMSGVVAGLEARGAGIEIRLFGADPDAAEERARALDHPVLSACADKPHGLRECHIVAPFGYVFVPSRASDA